MYTLSDNDPVFSLSDFNAGSYFTSYVNNGEPTLTLDVTPFVQSAQIADDSRVLFNIRMPTEDPTEFKHAGYLGAGNPAEERPMLQLTVVPVPAAVWAGLALLGGIGVIRRIRQKRQAA